MDEKLITRFKRAFSTAGGNQIPYLCFIKSVIASRCLTVPFTCNFTNDRAYLLSAPNFQVSQFETVLAVVGP